MTKQIANIQHQEAILDKGAELVCSLEALIAEWQRFQSDFSELMAYYGSELWLAISFYDNAGISFNRVLTS